MAITPTATALAGSGQRPLGEPQRFDWWGRRKDGSFFPKEVTLKRSTYFGQDVVIAVARDVTAQKEAEAALRRAVEIDPDFVPAYTALAEVYFGTQQPDRAIGEYKKITERRPDVAALDRLRAGRVRGAAVLASFAGGGLLLAAIGLYGVLAQVDEAGQPVVDGHQSFQVTERARGARAPARAPPAA